MKNEFASWVRSLGYGAVAIVFCLSVPLLAVLVSILSILSIPIIFTLAGLGMLDVKRKEEKT